MWFLPGVGNDTAQPERAASHPTLLREVRYQMPNIACFPSFLGLPIRHGFTWGRGSMNMSYKWHIGEPDVITRRVEGFLRALHMAPRCEAIVLEVDSADLIVDVTQLHGGPIASTDDGRLTGAQAVFTDLPGVPVTIKPGDCLATLVYGRSVTGSSVVGIIHTGRKELESHFAQRAVEHVTHVFRCHLRDLRIGILPGLGVDSHVIQARDMDTVVGNRESWQDYTYSADRGSTFRLDAPRFLRDQYLRAGVLPHHIEAYDIDTFKAAQAGETFSHRYALATRQPERNGRLMVAIQLIGVDIPSTLNPSRSASIDDAS